DELLDRPVVPEGFLGEVFEDARDEHLELLRIEVLRSDVNPTKSAKSTVTRRRSWCCVGVGVSETRSGTPSGRFMQYRARSLSPVAERCKGHRTHAQGSVTRNPFGQA